LFPHPYSDPAGHSYGRPPPTATPPDPERWQTCLPYLHGLDLFNLGYYWEAHEAWEALWHACGRRGDLAGFFKALIHLAAAGVKVREGRKKGVRHHAARALELLQALAVAGEGDNGRIMGLSLAELIAAARHVETASLPSPRGLAVEGVFPFHLMPARVLDY
jgi:predicted metal-dependent hydrolase